MTLQSKPVRSTSLGLTRGIAMTPILFGLVLAVGAAGVGSVYFLRPIMMHSSAEAEKSAVLALPYTEFRTQLVRDGIAEAVLAACGVEIIEKQVLVRDIDLRTDPRPILNALARKSQSTVYQEQRIVLRLPENNIQTPEIELMQQASIDSEQTVIRSTLTKESGLLQEYVFEICAEPDGEQTSIRFVMRAEIETQSTPILQSYIQGRVQQGVETQLQRQAEAFLQAFRQR